MHIGELHDSEGVERARPGGERQFDAADRRLPEREGHAPGREDEPSDRHNRRLRPIRESRSLGGLADGPGRPPERG